MNRLRNIVSLVAVCATAAFFTGCGEDDSPGDGGGNNGSNVPASFNGRTYQLTDAGGATTIAFDPGANTYTLTPSGGGAAETGSFTPTQSGETVNIDLLDGTTATNSNLALTFTGAGVGTYTLTRPGVDPVSGNFAETGGGNPGETDGTVPPTTDGNGTVAPPATLNSISVTTIDSGIGPNAHYTVNFNGNQFTAIDQGGTEAGSGTYTYTPNNANNTGHLVLNYTTPNGDVDDMNLIFTTQPGGGANNFNGSQIVSGANHNFTGTFTY